MKYGEMKEAAKKADVMKDLTPNFFEFEKQGDGFVGKFIASAAVDSSLGTGTYNQYLFETDDGMLKCAFGAATDKEVVPLMKVGGIYSVEFVGKVKIGGGKSVNKFKVYEIDPSLLPKPESKEDVPF